VLDAVAAAAIVIYIAVDVEVAVVVGVATAVIIFAMADQDAGNVTTLTEPALVFLLAATQPPVVLPLVAIVALLAPALPVTFTGHVKVTVILLIRVATNLEETEKVKLFVTHLIVTGRLVLTRMVVIPTTFVVVVPVGRRCKACRFGNRGHRCADDRCRCGDASHVLQKLTPLYWFHIFTPSLDVCHTLVAGDRGVYLKALIEAATKQEELLLLERKKIRSIVITLSTPIRKNFASCPKSLYLLKPPSSHVQLGM
jgi:hypothetical protein